MPVPPPPVRFALNPTLPTIQPLTGPPGTPVGPDGCFQNREQPFRHALRTVAQLALTRNPQRAEKQADLFRLPVQPLPQLPPASAGDVLVWLGHASFFVRLGGVSVLLDPVLGDLPFGGRRRSALPLPPAALTGIDYLLVSHAHYDHCDKASLHRLHAQNPQAPLLTGLGTDQLLRRWLPGAEVQAAGWYQPYRTDPRLHVTFLPTRHWSNRTPWDANQTSWGAFVLQGGGRQLYFGGDSGYGAHFREVGQLFPQLDVAILGVGAYAPRWFMAPNHQDPAHALQAFRDTGAKALVPMHCGTFDLSHEPLGEPWRELQAARAAGQVGGALHLLAAGQPLPLGG